MCSVVVREFGSLYEVISPNFIATDVSKKKKILSVFDCNCLIKLFVLFLVPVCIQTIQYHTIYIKIITVTLEKTPTFWLVSKNER